MRYETSIDGYSIEVDNDMGDGATGCWVTHKTVTGRRFTASLQLLEAGGALTNHDGSAERRVDGATLEKIAEYAESKGY